MFLGENNPAREGKERIHKTVIFKLPLAFQSIPNILKTCGEKPVWGFLVVRIFVWYLGGGEDEAKEEEEISKET